MFYFLLYFVFFPPVLDNFLETELIPFTFDEGAEATIPCNQQASVPEPSVFWTDDSKTGKTIELDNRVSIDPNFNLRFSNIKIEDMMNYQCNVKNEKIRTQLLSPIKEVTVRPSKFNSRCIKEKNILFIWCTNWSRHLCFQIYWNKTMTLLSKINL